jgi:hypothetical protein
MTMEFISTPEDELEKKVLIHIARAEEQLLKFDQSEGSLARSAQAHALIAIASLMLIECKRRFEDDTQEELTNGFS